MYRLLPGFTDLAFGLPVLLLCLKDAGVRKLLEDGDTGWHIRTGEWILAHHAVPKADPFSFSRPGQPWFAWEWGWDVLFGWVHTRTGLPGVVCINLFLVCLVSVLLFRLVRRVSENDVLAFALSALAMAGSSIHWLARPHIAGWFFFLVFAHAVDRASRGDQRMLWWLPLLTALWTNLHASFFVGITMLLVFAAGSALRESLFREPCRLTVPPVARSLGFCAAACALASFVNPYGFALHRHLITYLLDSKQLENIGEYQSISFHASGSLFFELFLVLTGVVLYWCLRQRRLAEGLWLALWCHLALLAARNIPLFLFAAAPLLALTIQELAALCWAQAASLPIRRLGAAIANAGLEFRPLERLPRVPVASLALVLLTTALVFHPGDSPNRRAEYDPKSYPAGAVSFLASSRLSNVFSDDEWGDYLIYRLYPACRVFVDGRSDFYGANFGGYLDVMNARYDWEKNLSRFAIDAILLRGDAPLATVLKESHRWKPVYDDGVALVFRPTRESERQRATSSPLSGEKDLRPPRYAGRVCPVLDR